MRAFTSLTALMLLALAGSAGAHESRPLYIEIEQRGDDRYALRWKAPATLDLANTPRVEMPVACTATAAVTWLR